MATHRNSLVTNRRFACFTTTLPTPPSMDSLWQDLRYGLRGLRNQPAFTALAALALALGIGATTTIFSVIQNVLLDPFPYKDADRVVAFQIRNAERPTQGGRSMFQTAEWLDYRE